MVRSSASATSGIGRFRGQEWIKFLDLLTRQTPDGIEVHVSCDNYATHKHANLSFTFKGSANGLGGFIMAVTDAVPAAAPRLWRPARLV